MEICTGCEKAVDKGDLIPWSGQRLCWDCMDFQLDLLAKAVSDDVMVDACAAELAEVLAVDLAFLAGHLTTAEHQDMLRLATSLPREARTA